MSAFGAELITVSIPLINNTNSNDRNLSYNVALHIGLKVFFIIFHCITFIIIVLLNYISFIKYIYTLLNIYIYIYIYTYIYI